MSTDNFVDFLNNLGMPFDEVLTSGEWGRVGWESRFLGYVRDNVVASSRVVLTGGPVRDVDYGYGGVVIFVDRGGVVRAVSRSVRAARIAWLDVVPSADVALRDVLTLPAGFGCFSVFGSCVVSSFLLDVVFPPAVCGVRLVDVC